MKIRVVAADAPAAIEAHEVADLAYDIQASDFSIAGGAIRVRLMNAPLPISIVVDGAGLIFWFRSAAEASQFSESLREAGNTAWRLNITMLD